MSFAVATLPTESELNSYKIIAKVAASNQHWRKLGGNGDDESIIATILSVMLLARELGLPPMQSIAGGINNIQGKFEISARIMNQLIRKHGHIVKVKVQNNHICTIWGKRRDTGEEMEVSYHIDEARTAGLIKPGGGWVKCPQDMLFARCISRLARRLTPDCIGGCYIEGELQETILKQTVDAPEIPVIEQYKEEEVTLQIPEDVDHARVDLFLLESTMGGKYTVDGLKKRASGNMEVFIQEYHKWEDRQKKLLLKQKKDEEEENLVMQKVQEFDEFVATKDKV